MTNRTKRTLAIPRWIAAGMTMLMAVLLCVQCLAMYRAGMSAENMTAEGMRIHDIFSREIIAAHAAPLILPFALWIVSLIVSALCKPEKPAAKPSVPVTMPQPVRRQRLIRSLLLVAGVILVIIGVLNGGMYDVLVKAINICTECIGLG